MVKKKADLDFSYEEEEPAAAEVGETDAEEEYDEEHEEIADDEEDEDEEYAAEKRGGGARIALLAVLLLVAVGAGAYAWLSSGGNLGNLLSSVPFIGKPTPLPATIGSGSLPLNAEESTAPDVTKVTAPLNLAGSGSSLPAGLASKPGSSQLVVGKAPRPVAQPVGAKTLVGTTAANGKKLLAPVNGQKIPKGLMAKAVEPAAVTKVAKHQTTKQKAMRQSQLVKASRNRAAASGRAIRKMTRQQQIAGLKGKRRGIYTIQVGAFGQPDNARKLIAHLRAQGFDAYGNGGGEMGSSFVVRSNTVDSREKAETLAEQFRQAGQKPDLRAIGPQHYVVTLGTFSSEEEAGKLVSNLNSKGLFATVGSHTGTKTVNIPDRVMVGRYASRSEAQATASRLRAMLGTAMVVQR
ncbi:MAG: SPOR domain-containing protein [Cyanobacteria bacterium NC_groundwater_1444_Ag_S-0.65um_54_12]|nr:SPOR domain-containing protein [Cyanobacteria bacterium NC_groundwater_1444_Ag_S-0.65um_54_12]